MSDTPQGPGWWQASDDKWYPPPRPVMPGEEAAGAGAPAPTAPTAPSPGVPGPGAPTFGPPPGAPSGGYPTGPPTAPVPGPPMAPVPGASGPYGSVPPGMPGAPVGPPPGGDGNRTPLFVVLGVLGAAAVVLLIFLVAGGGGDDEEGGDGPETPTDTTDATGPDETDPPTTNGPDETVPQGEGDVQVIDQGFSNFEDTFGDPAGSFGFVLENQGDNILQSVETQVVIYGSGDRVITTKDFSVGTIRPGEKMGFGDEMYGEDLQDGIDRLEIQVRHDSADPANPADIPEGGFEVANVDLTSDEYNMTVTFDLTSTYSVEDVGYPSIYVIFRNAEDEIVGAAWGSASFDTEPQASVEVTTYDVIPDVENTEVYVDPGYIYNP